MTAEDVRCTDCAASDAMVGVQRQKQKQNQLAPNPLEGMQAKKLRGTEGEKPKGGGTGRDSLVRKTG